MGVLSLMYEDWVEGPYIFVYEEWVNLLASLIYEGWVDELPCSYV